MSGHILALPNGGCLDLDSLPQQATMEMLQACRDRIFALEALNASKGPVTPVRQARARRKSAPDSGMKPQGPSKTLSSAQISKEKRSIVKEIKRRITPLKFHEGLEKTEREVKFTADRFPPEAAEQLLGISREAWSSATMTAAHESNDIMSVLSLAPDELKGSVWLKGGAQPGRRFGAVRPQRVGVSTLQPLRLTLSYTVKSLRLAGSLSLINGPATAAVGGKRGRGEAFGFGPDGLSDEEIGEALWEDLLFG